MNKNKSGTYTFRNAAYEKLADAELMLDSVIKKNIVDPKCGIEFWQARVPRYKELLDIVDSKSGGVSQNSATKAELRKKMNTNFNNIISLIKCNVPKNRVAAEMRSFGFLKERY